MSSLMRSTMMRVILFIEIFLFMSSVMGDYRDFRDNSNKKFCGRILTDSLALLCDGEYEAIIHPSKRSDELMDEYYNDQPWDPESMYPPYASPLLSKLLPPSSALSSQIRQRVRRDWVPRRGVFDECCTNPCSFATLKSYCKRSN